MRGSASLKSNDIPSQSILRNLALHHAFLCSMYAAFWLCAHTSPNSDGFCPDGQCTSNDSDDDSIAIPSPIARSMPLRLD